jgi:hypothetical protein
MQLLVAVRQRERKMRNLREKTSPVFWFMMQIEMIAGFLTTYPVNRWLLQRGIKEEM